MKNKIIKSGILLAIIALFTLLGAFLGLQFFQEEFDEIKELYYDIKNNDLYDNSKVRTILVNDQELSVDLNLPQHTWFDAKQMSTEIPNKITIENLNEYTVYVNDSKVDDGETIEIELDHLSHAIGIELKLVDKNTSETLYYYIRTLHTIYDAVSTGKGDGFYYFTQNNAIYKMNHNGEIVFYKETDIDYNFRQFEIDGKTYYTYFDISQNNSDELLENTGYSRARAVIMNDTYEIIDEVYFLNSEQGLPENHSLENHEFIMLDEGHYIISGYVGKSVTNIPSDIKSNGQGEVVATIIQEIKDGELIWQWDSTDYPELYGMSIEKNDYTSNIYQDYLHYNSLDIDPKDGNYICSFRNLDSILKIDSTTGDIIWILGGKRDQFGLTEEQLFSRQHFARYYNDNSISIHDNGNVNEQTRVVEYELDETNKKILSFNSYEIEGFYGATMGSSMRLDDTKAEYLVGWGSRSPNGIMFSHINFETGETIFEVMDLDSEFDQNTYRAYNFDS